MFQRLKNKKGFTLIELIVVIAILGILALIAIPRFAGFTERARIGNDEQYAALVANSTMIMAAANEIPYAKDQYVAIDISPNGSVAAVRIGTDADGTGGTALDDTALGTYNTALLNLVAKKGLTSTEYTAGLQIVTNDAGAKDVTKKTVANPGT